MQFLMQLCTQQSTRFQLTYQRVEQSLCEIANCLLLYNRNDQLHCIILFQFPPLISYPFEILSVRLQFISVLETCQASTGELCVGNGSGKCNRETLQEVIRHANRTSLAAVTHFHVYTSFDAVGDMSNLWPVGA